MINNLTKPTVINLSGHLIQLVNAISSNIDKFLQTLPQLNNNNEQDRKLKQVKFTTVSSTEINIVSYQLINSSSIKMMAKDVQVLKCYYNLM